MDLSAVTPPEPLQPPDQSAAIAATAEHAIQELCRLTLSRPRLSTAELHAIIAHLAGLTAALPQALAQLSDMLTDMTSDPQVPGGELSDTDDPSLAVDTAALCLSQAREVAVDLCHHLDIASTQTAQFAVEGSPG